MYFDVITLGYCCPSYRRNMDDACHYSRQSHCFYQRDAHIIVPSNEHLLLTASALRLSAPVCFCPCLVEDSESQQIEQAIIREFLAMYN